MRWLDSIIDSMDLILSKLQEIVKDREAWHATVHRVAMNRTWLRQSLLVLLSQQQSLGAEGATEGNQMVPGEFPMSALPTEFGLFHVEHTDSLHVNQCHFSCLLSSQ